MPETAWIASLGVGAFLSHQKGSERGRFSHLSNVEFPVDRFLRRIGESVDALVHDAFAERRERLYGHAVNDPAWRLPAALSSHPTQLQRAGTDPKRRWVDGTPLNSHFVWALAMMFPAARFIHNLRRPDEVATSLESFDRVGAEPQALEQGLDTWVLHTENAWRAERGLGGDRVFRLEFERIANDPEALFREVCAFLDEPWAPDCLAPLQQKLNSSQVDEKRTANRELLRENEKFRHAEAVYELVAANPGGNAPDAEAWAVIEQRFLDHCFDRELV